MEGVTGMVKDFGDSLSDQATFGGQAKPQRAELSLGDERTLGDGLAGQDTGLDGIEAVDLEARYTIEGTLGQGGMGAVLLATDTRLDRKVAIKRILGEAAGNRMAVNRFLTEAKSIAALNHPNIVQIYDYGRAKDGPFLIMEFVDGGSLLDRCRDGAMPLVEAIELACQLCDGLAKAHDLGIIHRDIKPANVLLTKDGIPKLTDFGLAKAHAGDHGQTMIGAVIGTPDFMPPEQRRDASLVDHRSDLWSLAATVYQMVTGKSPKIIRFKDVPETIQTVLGKALEDAKDERYQTVREFRDVLKASLRHAVPLITTIDAGQCPGCGTQNDASRKFCRGCGASLECPCLSCGKGMPLWEDICGQCGSKQEPLLEPRRASMAVQQAQAERLLSDCEFAMATAIATSLKDETHEKLKHLKPWGEQFLARVETARVQQQVRASEALAEAIKHEQACDFLSGIFTLEMVPAALQSMPLPNSPDSVASALARLKAKQAESLKLEKRIKERLASKLLTGLLPDVERLLSLLPGRSDLVKLKSQLDERQVRLVATRDEAIARATERLTEQDYEAAVAVLAQIDPSVETAEVTDLRKRSESKLKRVRELADQIRSAVASKRYQGLLASLEELLVLRPRDAEALKLRQSLLAREERVASDIRAACEKARTLSRNCRFEEAVDVLRAIPEEVRPPESRHLLNQCVDLARARSAAIEVLTRVVETGINDDVSPWTHYHQLLEPQGIVDTELEELARCGVQSCAERRDAETKAERKRVRTRYLVATASTIPVVVVAVGLALWGYSEYRGHALRQRVAAEQWDEAIAIDPASSEALIGRAIARLTGPAKNIGGAFEDLQEAELSKPVGGRLAFAKRLAFATRASDHAVHRRMKDAEADIAESRRWGGDTEIAASVQQTMADGWIAVAMSDLQAKQIAGVAIACNAAEKYGADGSQLAELRAAAFRIDAAAKSQQGDLAGAIALLKKYREIAPGQNVASEEAVIRIALGAQAAKRSDASQAAKELRAALDLDRSVPGAVQLAGQLVESLSLAMQAGQRPERIDDAVLLLSAVALLPSEPSATSALRTLTADALFARVGELVSGGKLDAAIRDYDNGLTIAGRASGLASVRQPLVSALVAQCEASLRDNAYAKAVSFYQQIKRLDVVAGDRVKESLAKLPRSVIAQNRDIRIELESVSESFNDPASKLFVYSGRQQKGVTGLMGDASKSSFFRLTSGLGIASQKKEPWALCFPSQCRVGEEVPIRINFRCRRRVLEPQGSASFLAIVIGSPTSSGEDAFESEAAPGRITLYNDTRLAHSQPDSDYIGCENVQQKGVAASMAIAEGEENSDWRDVEIMLENHRRNQDTLLLKATVSSGGRQLVDDFILDAPVVGAGRKLFGCNVFFMVFGNAGDPAGDAASEPGSATGCIYDLTDVGIAPVYGGR